MVLKNPIHSKAVAFPNLPLHVHMIRPRLRCGRQARPKDDGVAQRITRRHAMEEAARHRVAPMVESCFVDPLRGSKYSEIKT